MKHLQSLVLTDNDGIQAEGFPQGMFAMQTPEVLDISNMYFLNMSLPMRLELPNLQQFYASGSKLHGYLPTIWNIPKLESLVLDLNDLKGQLQYYWSKTTDASEQHIY